MSQSKIIQSFIRELITGILLYVFMLSNACYEALCMALCEVRTDT